MQEIHAKGWREAEKQLEKVLKAHEDRGETVTVAVSIVEAPPPRGDGKAHRYLVTSCPKPGER